MRIQDQGGGGRCSIGNIQAVHHLVQQDRRVSIKHMCAETGLSVGTNIGAYAS